MPTPINPALPFLACCCGAGTSAQSCHAGVSVITDADSNVIASLPVLSASLSGAVEQIAGNTTARVQRSKVIQGLSVFRNGRLLLGFFSLELTGQCLRREGCGRLTQGGCNIEPLASRAEHGHQRMRVPAGSEGYLHFPGLMRERQDCLRTCQYRCALIANGEGQQRWISFLAISAQVRQPGTGSQRDFAEPAEKEAGRAGLTKRGASQKVLLTPAIQRTNFESPLSGPG